MNTQLEQFKENRVEVFDITAPFYIPKEDNTSQALNKDDFNWIKKYIQDSIDQAFDLGKNQVLEDVEKCIKDRVKPEMEPGVLAGFYRCIDLVKSLKK